MAKLSPETAQTIWELQHQLLEIINSSITLELSLFDAFGETENTIPILEKSTETEFLTPPLQERHQPLVENDMQDLSQLTNSNLLLLEMLLVDIPGAKV
jgi:hypothetical protein